MKFYKSLPTLFVVLLLALPTFALDIPDNLSKKDRQQVTKILGHTTSTKLLSIPYPLSGYSGFEVSLSTTNVPVSELSFLGNTTNGQSEFSYQTLSIAKGLYGNFDVHLHFAPPIGNVNYSSYGGALKWSFFQGSYLPYTLSFLIHGNSSTTQDSFSSSTLGGEFIYSLYVQNLVFYFGAGPIKTRSTFLGQGPTSFLTDSGSNESELERTLHSYIGMTYLYDIYFFTLQADRYTNNTISFNLGLRL